MVASQPPQGFAPCSGVLCSKSHGGISQILGGCPSELFQLSQGVESLFPVKCPRRISALWEKLQTRWPRIEIDGYAEHIYDSPILGGIPLPSSPSDEGWVFYATASQPFRVQEAFQTQAIEFWRFFCAC